VEPVGAKRQRSSRLGAHAGGHQQLDHLHPIVERQVWCLPVQERPGHVPILGRVAVLAHLVGHDRHQPDLGVLLLDQIVTRLATHLAAEEQLQPAVERVEGHRVLGPEQLHAQPEPGAHTAPRGAGLADQRRAVVRLVLDRDAGEVLGRVRAAVDVSPMARRSLSL